MSEDEKSPTGQSRAAEVFSDQTNGLPMPTTQENCTLSLTRNTYGVIGVNPPLSFQNWNAKWIGRNAISHYAYSTLEELAVIADSAANNCVLFLWPVGPLFDKPFELIRTWGFKYEAIGYFCFKQNIRGEGFFTDLGSWTRASPERCLLATRGKPKRWAKDVSSVVFAPRREHRRNPDEVRKRIQVASSDFDF